MRPRLFGFFVLGCVALAGCSRAPAPQKPAVPKTKPTAATSPVTAPTAPAVVTGELPAWRQAINGTLGQAPMDPNVIKLPKDGGAWPWKLAAAPTGPSTKPAMIHDYRFVLTKIHGVSVDAVAGEAMVFLSRSQPNGKFFDSFTDIFRLDLKTGETLKKWSLPGTFFLFDWHPDRTRLLAMRRNNFGEDLTRVELWTIGADGAFQRRPWQPDPNVRQEKTDHLIDQKIDWAGFVGPNHVGTLSERGRFALWDNATLKRTGWIDALPVAPAVTPDRSQVAVAMAQGVALIDPASKTPIGVRRIGRAPEKATLAFTPDGKMLTCIGSGRILTLDLETGAARTNFQVSIEPTDFAPIRENGAIGPRHVWVNGKLYDPAIPLPLCVYKGSDWAKPLGHRLWAVVKTKTTGATLVSYKLPHAGLDDVVRANMARTDVFLLKPGDSVRVDVKGVDAKNREWVRQSLEKIVRNAGYVVTAEANAKAVLTAAVDATGRKTNVNYYDAFGFGKLSATYGYEIRDAHAKFTLANQILWEDHAHHPPPNTIGGNDTLGAAGNPDYDLFVRAKIPEVVFNTKNATEFADLHMTPRGYLVDFVENARSNDPLGPTVSKIPVE